MSDVAEYRCAHCESENLIRHCPSDCGWARCKDCNLVTDFSRTRDSS